ncbi:NADP-dependent phosphogluconate dehydrogenase [Aquiflexum sp.]|uniref:NADP-dependent phosphogluconate dehydrogenase n=1 Tax=Aquiflexum sp. TaxID=1872584 RepID=UPI003593D062
MIIIVTGVSGSGKTTLSSLLAKKLRLPFFDADDFHPPANIQKMSMGIPLTDQDRLPWLEHLADSMQQWEGSGGGILACSALRENYRETLQVVPKIIWLHLKGSKELLHQRMNNREGHYMKPGLLDSQLETWEEPDYGIHLDVSKAPETLLEEVMKLDDINAPESHFGVIGMGVMGKSLALNLAENGVPTAVYNRHVPGKEEKIASGFAENNQEFPLLKGFDDLDAFVGSLAKPRKILLMIPAGAAIDQQIQQLEPMLEQGDIIIDGGNSFFEDSTRRFKELIEKGLHFIPMGVSGGEEGARKGPSMMPGGKKEAYDFIAPYLKKIAAKDATGKACVSYIGPDGSGHFIKMVHNSIEYAEMQVLSETVHLMKYGLKLSYTEISNILKSWGTEGLKSYLLDITEEILTVKEGKNFLLDQILDKAEQKGTGGWSLTTALKYHVPYSPLSEAVTARLFSSQKEDREELAVLYSHRFGAFAEDKVILLEKLKNAYTLTRIINHEVGFNLMHQVSEQENWNLDFSEISRIWTNGCIIRSSLMENMTGLFKENSSLLKTKAIKTKLKEIRFDLAYIIGLGLQHSYALPVMSGAANYLFGRITSDSSANLIQAQRDFFGAHTFQRKEDPTGGYYHSDWKN